ARRDLAVAIERLIEIVGEGKIDERTKVVRDRDAVDRDVETWTDVGELVFRQVELFVVGAVESLRIGAPTRADRSSEPGIGSGDRDHRTRRHRHHESAAREFHGAKLLGQGRISADLLLLLYSPNRSLRQAETALIGLSFLMRFNNRDAP